MIVLGLLATSFAYRAGIESRSVRNKALMAQLRAHASSAAAIAIGRIRDNTNDYDHFAEPWHTHRELASQDWIPEWMYNQIDEPPVFVSDYQVIDEEGKLHVLTASSQALEKLGMSEEQIASFFDWMDADGTAQAEGAEKEYYLAKLHPYNCKNAPFEFLDELLLVRGFGRFGYLGEDANHNRRLDPRENDGSVNYPSDDANGQLRLGWVDLLTCVGESRINLNTAPEAVLEVLPISSSAVDQIIGYREFDENSSGNLEDHVFRSQSDIEQLQGLSEADQEVLQAIATYSSSHFRIFVQSVHIPTGLRYHLQVLVRSSLENEPEILQWKVGI
jgi:type II secretory pathway component PulK